MVLPITQQTFDEAVQENINDLGLSPEEALTEAVAQFKAQGADLSQIITEPGAASAVENLTNAIKKLSEFKDTNISPECLDQIAVLKQMCDKGIQYRVQAGKAGAYDAILDIFLKSEAAKDTKVACLKAMISLMTKQPDLLDGNSEVLKDVLLVLRALILDDDVRVEFGRAHEHARIIASETLSTITGLINKFKADASIINDLMLTLSSLLVRAEFCIKVEETGGVELMQDVMTTFMKNDNVVQTASAGLNCVAALSLRCPENSKALFEAGLPEVIINVMRKHPDEKSVQRPASWAIRNMVSRSRYQNKHFLELGAEELLQKNLAKFKEFEYDTKAALRDLECDVELKEEWTGPGPGKYLLPPLVGYKDHDPSRYRNPQYSMGQKLTRTTDKQISPGPKYYTENMTMYGKVHPRAYSIVSRKKEQARFQGPGPAAYNIQNAPRMKEQRPPAYSISYRHELHKTFETPGPNNYDVPTTIGPKVPDKRANGAFSMSHRYPVTKKEISPGPARYDPISPDNYKNKLPAYSMSIRHKPVAEKGSSPGPSNYYPKLASKGGYSFGLKTDTSPYITPEDEMPCINK
ncbi:hypothetical protein BDFB_006691 [Asbolus verrucosus]|uniref:Armadillo repeat-containing protein 6 n=1 Tax=Asbolus verrucosus TaxID=1661398 RepID=A0A482WA13_ASBVE|nr:hypothetical protein BDFB_006691 [Asbolus verrucosus]